MTKMNVKSAAKVSMSELEMVNGGEKIMFLPYKHGYKPDKEDDL